MVPLPLKLSGELGFLSSFVEHVHSTEDRLCNLFSEDFKLERHGMMMRRWGMSPNQMSRRRGRVNLERWDQV
jgi:hypothetical protein